MKVPQPDKVISQGIEVVWILMPVRTFGRLMYFVLIGV